MATFAPYYVHSHHQSAGGWLKPKRSNYTIMSTTSSLNSSNSLKPDFAQMQQARFNQADTDGDGVLNQDELQAMMAKNPHLAKALASLAPTADGSAPTAADIMKKLDANGDGTLSSAELSAGLKQARANMRAGGHHQSPKNDGDQDDSGGTASAASSDTDLKTLLEQFLAKLQSDNGPTGSSVTTSSSTTTIPGDTTPSGTGSPDQTLADLLTQILAKMKPQNGYASNGTSNAAPGSNAAILQTLA